MFLSALSSGPPPKIKVGHAEYSILFWKRQETSLALQAKEVSLMYKLSTKDAARSIQNQNPAQRSAEVVNEAQSARAVLILRGGATERVRDGVCFEKENAVANDTKSATTCVRTPIIIQFGVSYLQAGVGARWVQIMKTTLRPLFSRNTSNWALWWYYSFAKPINNYSGEYILLRSVSAKSLTAGERT